MRFKLRTLLVILSVSLNIAFVAAWGTKTFVTTAHAAKQEQRGCNPDSCRVWCPLHRALGTTDTQWRTLEPMQRAFQTASRTLSDSADVLRGELADLLAKPEVNQAAVDEKQREILGIQQEMQSLVVKHLLEEKSVLTSEQQAKLFAMMRDQGGCAQQGGWLGGGRHDGSGCGEHRNRKTQE